MSGVPSQKCATSGNHCHHTQSDEYIEGQAVHKTTNLILDISEARREINGKNNEDDIAFGVAKRAKTIVLLLSGGIPQSKLYNFTVECDLSNIVLKNSRDVSLLLDTLAMRKGAGCQAYLREPVLGINNE